MSHPRYKKIFMLVVLSFLLIMLQTTLGLAQDEVSSGSESGVSSSESFDSGVTYDIPTGEEATPPPKM